MKMIISSLIIAFALISCNQPNTNSNADELAAAIKQDSQQETYNYDFREYGFTLKSPCKLEDVSSQVKGDFLINYGGVINQDNPNTMAAYQLIVSRLPVGYKDVPKNVLESKFDDFIRTSMSHMKNLKSIRFGYEGYKGYVGETTHNGMKQKWAIFLKDNYTIALTVMSNDNIEAKFNSFTNGFKSVSSQSKTEKKGTPKLNTQKLSFGYSVSAPCILKQYPSQDADYSYSGAINPDNKDIAIVYKVQVSSLPMRYSQMSAYNQKTIKNNLLNYLRSKDNYSECKVGVRKHFAYKANYSESGFKFKECMLLTDNHIIELMMFSKKGVSDSQFIEFVNSLKKN